MIVFFLTLLRRVFFFMIPIVIGAFAYLVLHEGGEMANAKPVGFVPPDTVPMGRGIPFEADPILLARTENPVDVTGDALGTFFVLQQDGKIIRIEDHSSSSLSVSTLYADLDDGMTEPGIGFSAMVLHPHFLLPERPGYGKFYVVVAESAGSADPDFLPEFGGGSEHHQDVLYEFTAGHPLAANFTGMKREILRFSQPGAANNLTSLAFDPAGHLYLALGDGADGGTTPESASNNASSLTSAYGKVLRIDPTKRNSLNGNYGIPDTNPFRLVSEALPELWAFGLRAPHSLHYDPFRSILCIGETLRDGVEKVNLSSHGGEHFGWDLSESPALFGLSNGPRLSDIVTSSTLSLDRRVEPLAHSVGSVVYRGENFPSLAGKLIFANGKGDLFVCDSREPRDTVTRASALMIESLGRKSFSSIKCAPTGEIILLCEDGAIYELTKRFSADTHEGTRQPLYCSLGKKETDSPSPAWRQGTYLSLAGRGSSPWARAPM